MASRNLSKPQLNINDIVFDIVPNSLKVTYGNGTKIVKTQSSGGSSRSTVTSHNIEEAVGKISCEIFVNEENTNQLLDLIELNESQNLKASFTNPGAGIGGVLKNSSIINDPEFNFTSEGKVEINLEGDSIKRV